MEIRRTRRAVGRGLPRSLAAGAIGLAFLAGGVGCGKVAEKASEKAVEKALESSGDCENIDFDGDGGVKAECDGETLDIAGEGGADLPEGWPGDLALPDGAEIVFSAQTSGTLTVTANVAGEVADVAEAVAAQLETAGYTVEDESTADAGGIKTASIRAEGPEFQAAIAVSNAPSVGDESDLVINYTLTPAAEG